MIHIADSDLPEVKTKICQALSMLNDGAKRVDLDINTGDNIDILKLTGYHIGDNVLRIDIKVIKWQ